MSVPSPSDPVVQELTSLDASVAEILKDRDSASRLLQLLPEKYELDAAIRLLETGTDTSRVAVEK